MALGLFSAERRPLASQSSGSIGQGRFVMAAAALHGVALALALLGARTAPSPELPPTTISFVLEPKAEAPSPQVFPPSPAAENQPTAAPAPPPEQLPAAPPVVDRGPGAAVTPPPRPPPPAEHVLRPAPLPRAAPRVPRRAVKPSQDAPGGFPSAAPTAPAPTLPVAPSEPAAPAPPPAAPAPAVVSAGWQGSLGAWLQRHKSYPEAARTQGQQGAVGVRFTVAHDGRILSVSVSRSSGSEALDDAALSMLRGAQVPAFPDSMTQPTVTITVAIHYTLDE